LQKDRLRPAAALLKLSRKYLADYPALHEELDLEKTRRLIDDWLARLEEGAFKQNPLPENAPPQLKLSHLR
jgi:hypothetical protein